MDFTITTPGLKFSVHTTCSNLHGAEPSRAEPSRAAAEVAMDIFAEYRAKYERAVDCLIKDRSDLLSFYDFPAEHWIHLRTTSGSAQ